MRTGREVCPFPKAKPGSTLGPRPLNKRTPPAPCGEDHPNEGGTRDQVIELALARG